mmetsp:Transcript_24970/g.99170  ORF Transcript_24970/g.99170 Transcript_24970/m.99170 type:complete len:184 (+) Transcript_24970:227-778(+)
MCGRSMRGIHASPVQSSRLESSPVQSSPYERSRAGSPRKQSTLLTLCIMLTWCRPGEMAAAGLVVSHAGAGSLMEALALKKRVVAVVNAALMGNHQVELADALRRQRSIVRSRATLDHPVPSLVRGRERRSQVLAAAPTAPALVDAVAAATEATTLDTYPDVDDALFPKLVDAEMRRAAEANC